MTRSQVCAALAAFPPRGVSHKLMVGILASSKTIVGQPNKWPGRYPQPDAISGIFLNDPSVLNLIHYATDDKTDVPFRNQLEQLVEIGGENLHGFQLNVTRPSFEAIKDFRETHPDKKLVLQIGHRAMSELSGDPKRIAEYIGHYVPFIEYVLIDSSGGLGKPFNSDTALPILKAISAEKYPIRLGVAGGLGPNNMSHLKPILDIFPDISIDVEGKVRTPQPEDAMNMWSVSAFILESVRMFYPHIDLSDI